MTLSERLERSPSGGWRFVYHALDVPQPDDLDDERGVSA